MDSLQTFLVDATLKAATGQEDAQLRLPGDKRSPDVVRDLSLPYIRPAKLTWGSFTLVSHSA